MFLKPTKVIESILVAIDRKEKLPIFVNDFGTETEIVSVKTYGVERGYYINSQIDDIPKKISMTESIICGSEVLRGRMQVEKVGIELFPFVDVKEAGCFQDSLIYCLENNPESFEEIDRQFFGAASMIMWEAENILALPKIKHFASEDARYIIQATESLICS